MRQVVLEAGWLLRGSSALALETFLRSQSEVESAEAIYLTDTVTVTYDEGRLTEAALRKAIQECGYHAAPRAMHTDVLDYRMSRTVNLPYKDAVERTRQELARRASESSPRSTSRRH